MNNSWHLFGLRVVLEVENPGFERAKQVRGSTRAVYRISQRPLISIDHIPDLHCHCHPLHSLKGLNDARPRQYAENGAKTATSARYESLTAVSYPPPTLSDADSAPEVRRGRSKANTKGKNQATEDDSDVVEGVFPHYS